MNDLQWSKSQFEGTWDECMDWASSLCEDGHSDWRLPMIDELFSVFDRELGKPKIASFELVRYWSSTPDADNESDNESRAWYVNFNNGYVVDNGQTSRGYARCVRSKRKVKS